MGTRKRPRKNPTPEPEDAGDDSENIGEQHSTDENVAENPSEEIPTEGVNPTETSPQGMPIDTSQPKPPELVPQSSSNALEVPPEWSDIAIVDLAKQGWTYRKRIDDDGRAYMYIRNRTNERSLGRWSRPREKLLFEIYPILYRPKKIETEKPADEVQTDRSSGAGKRPFFNVPIKRIAVVPGDYRPTMDVIRYFHIFKNNNFAGDFSDFVNGIIVDHFVRCNGVVLPVFINEELIQKNA